MFRVLIEIVLLVILAGGLTTYVMLSVQKKNLKAPRRKKVFKPGDPEYTTYLLEELAEEDRRLKAIEDYNGESGLPK